MPSLDHLCTLGVLVCLCAALVLACLLERCRRERSDMARADEDNRTVPPKGGRP